MIKKRRCISCREVKDANLMIKLTKDFKTNMVIIDLDKKHFGRSAYICKDENCINTAFKKDKISKSLKKYLTNDEKENINTVLNSMIVVKH